MRLSSFVFAIAVCAWAQVTFNSGTVVSTDWPTGTGTERSKGVIMTARITHRSAPVVDLRTVAEPPLKSLGKFGGGLHFADVHLAHRFLYDVTSRTYSGYDIFVGDGDPTAGYKVEIRPLTNAGLFIAMYERPLKHLAEVDQTPQLTASPPPVYGGPAVVRPGDTIAVDLMVSADGTHKIVDYLKILPPPPDPGPGASTFEPRDFSVDDEPLSLSSTSFQRHLVLIDGQRFGGRVGYSNAPGGAIWIYIPKHGRFILSLAPHADFAKAGVVRDHVISFSAAGHEYEIRLGRPVVVDKKAYNLYLRSDPAYQPKASYADAVIVGMGRLEDLI